MRATQSARTIVGTDRRELLPKLAQASERDNPNLHPRLGNSPPLQRRAITWRPRAHHRATERWRERSANLRAGATNQCQKHGFNKMNCNLL